jgi:hypothetical protein
MRNGFLIYEEMRKYLTICMKRPLVIYGMTLHPIPSVFPYISGKILFSFLSVSSLRISENKVTIKAMTLVFIIAQTVRKKTLQ